MTIRVAVADDHALIREGLRSLVSSADDVDLLWMAATAAEASRLAASDPPDVLILDINMPDGSGIEVAADLQRSASSVAILMLTMFDDDDSVFAAIRAGAMGYVLKGADPEDLLRAISAVAAGHAILGPGVAARALVYLSAPLREEPAFPSLTPRERQVLDLIASGVGNARIAAQLVVSPNTVANHVTNIFAKLHVASRAEAIVRAREAGLGG